jgi:hypothetical protein
VSHALARFGSWAEVLEASRSGVQLWYASPIDVESAAPARAAAVTRVYKSGKIRVRVADQLVFTAEAGHLNRFFRKPRVVHVECPDASSYRWLLAHIDGIAVLRSIGPEAPERFVILDEDKWRERRLAAGGKELP